MRRSSPFAAAVLAVLVTTACAAQTSPPAEGISDEAVAAPERLGRPDVHHAGPPVSATPLERYQPRFGRSRPIVAVVASEDGAELTDFVVPHGILAASGAADVIALATAPGPIDMFPALAVWPDATTAEFDSRYPDGADYVIVPAVHNPDDPVLTGWIRKQAERGATIVGVCDGVLVLVSSGLLEGRRATAHWYSLAKLEEKHPETRWVRDQRYVADGGVVTTTGVSASVPVSLALVEAIAGSSRAERLADSLGVHDWGTDHDSELYGVSRRHFLTAAANMVAFWRKETVGVEVAPNVDGISLALLADAWGRTLRSSVLAIGPSREPVRTRAGLWLVSDRTPEEARKKRMLPPPSELEVGTAIDQALGGIADAYGDRTAALVALQLEYPWEVAK